MREEMADVIIWTGDIVKIVTTTAEPVEGSLLRG